MNVRLIILIIIFISSPVSAQFGFLLIENTPPGLDVVLDDSSIGVTGDSIFRIHQGQHSLIISHPRKGLWQADDFAEEVDISTNDTLFITPAFKTSLIIRSNPFNADVFIDDQFIGNTPLYHTAGKHNSGTLKIVKDNYLPFSIHMDELESSTLKVDLQQILKSELNEQDKHPNVFNKKRTLTAFVFTLSSGIATVYFNSKAEDYYDKYLVAGDPRQSDRYFKYSKRYDNYSNISFGVFEAGFVISLYSLIKTGEK